MLKLNFLFKRVFDILMSCTALVFFSPIFLFISVLIKVDSKGPVIFKQGRRGKAGRVFQMYKFRSMIVGAEKMELGLFNYKNDKRVTKIGKILRETSLDELPQLINILKGEMSFVGPRPCVTYELGDYDTLNKRYKKRFEVLPGITGLAQVCGRNEISWDEKVNYDNEYIRLFREKGILIDIKILFKTVINVFISKDVYVERDVYAITMDSKLSDKEAAKKGEEYIIQKAHEIEKDSIV